MIKITIEKKERVQIETREYQRVSDTGNERGNGPVYDYVSDPKGFRDVTVTLLSQEVEDVDIKAVIKAINGIA